MHNKTILITRPKGDETAIMELFHDNDYRVIHEPLTSIYLDHTKRQALHHALENEPDAVIITSRHAAQALYLLSDIRDLFLICVGESTAEMAMALGFSRVSVAGGNVEKLVAGIIDSYDEGSRFVYLSGEHVRSDLGALLAQCNMQVERLVLYEAVASDMLSDVLIEHLKRRQIDAVTFLSQRTAQIFTQLLNDAGMKEALTYLHAFCLSQTIADALKNEPWQQVHVSDEATLASLVECVDNVFQSKA